VLPLLAFARAEPDSAYFYCGNYVGLYTARIGNVPVPVSHYSSLLVAVEESLCSSSAVGSTLSIVHGSEAAESWKSDGTAVLGGVVFLGTGIPRSFWRPENDPLRPKSLSFIGELDGVSRVTRVGEDLFHGREDKNHVVIVNGGNHFGIMDDQDALDKSGDLKSEISQQDFISQFQLAFDAFLQNLDSNTQNEYLKSKRDDALSMLEPSLNAFALENNFYYGGQNQIGPDWDPDLCPTVWSADRGLCEENGAPWGVYAQRYVSGFCDEDSEIEAAGYKYNVTAKMAALSSRPGFKCPACLHHLPYIYVDENDPMQLTNEIYTQVFWDEEETYASAWTLHTKIFSRQCTYIFSGFKEPEEADYRELDGPSFCQEINQAAYDLVLESLEGTRALERFNENGVRMEMREDNVVIAGPSWLEFGLEYNERIVDGQVEALEIVARSLKTPYEFPYFPKAPDPRCYHYCHLLSPARIAEYIFTDSLRYNLGE